MDKKTIAALLLMIGFIPSCSSKNEVVHIPMPVAEVPEDGTYMCYTTPMAQYEGMSLVGFEMQSVKEIAHHAVLLACEDVHSNVGFWDCTKQQGHISKGRAVSLNGKDKTELDEFRLDFPDDVGLELGPDAKINYMVLQVHYKNKYTPKPNDVPSTNATLFLTHERKKFTRQAIFMASEGYIPAKKESFSSEQIIKWSGVTVEADTYAVHTHKYGLLVEAYIIKNGTISLIGRHSPHQHGTSMYKITKDKPLSISPGDVIVARCLHKNLSNKPIPYGTAHGNEMCTFSITFKVPTESALMYPRTILVSQSSQDVTWCNNHVYMSEELCELSNATY